MTKMTGQVGTKRLFLGQIGGVINHDQPFTSIHAFADAHSTVRLTQLEYLYAVSLEQSQLCQRLKPPGTRSFGNRQSSVLYVSPISFFADSTGDSLSPTSLHAGHRRCSRCASAPSACSARHVDYTLSRGVGCRRRCKLASKSCVNSLHRSTVLHAF